MDCNDVLNNQSKWCEDLFSEEKVGFSQPASQGRKFNNREVNVTQWMEPEHKLTKTLSANEKKKGISSFGVLALMARQEKTHVQW